MVEKLFYRPAGAWAADFIPLYARGAFRLFYLHDWRDRDRHGEGTPWYQISTTDFLHFAEHGEMLSRGSVSDQDLYVFTGSAIEAEGRFHIFYTGHNPHLRAAGRPEEAVMHAVSDDLLRWTKVPGDTFFSPQPGDYELHDWRDPFVFRNEEAGEYWMLLAARLGWGPSRRRGCTALCVSRDLRRWEVREPFYAPGLYYTHECPDLFRMGDWWYLVFSEFSEGCLTRYRMSRSLEGPWLAPDNDSFDGRAFYAAKTASDGRRRFIFGWNPTRVGEKDDGGWQWGGNLAVHEVVQSADGTLSVRPPESVDGAFSRAMPFEAAPALGTCRAQRRGLLLEAPSALAAAACGPLPSAARIETRVIVGDRTRACGLILRADADLEKGYYIRYEPQRARLVFDRWPRRGDVPFEPGLERPLRLGASEPLRLTVFVDGTVCEAYANGAVALSARLYEHAAGQWGLFTSEGSCLFEATSLRCLPD